MKQSKMFSYGLKFRPYDLATAPQGVVKWLSNADVVGQKSGVELDYFHSSDYRHGIVQYEKELSNKEIRDFELVDMNSTSKDLFDGFVEFAQEMKSYQIPVNEFIEDYIHPKGDYRTENPLHKLSTLAFTAVITKHSGSTSRTLSACVTELYNSL